MKKLMIALAAVAMAVGAEAAAVGWSCTAANAFKSGDYSVFIIGQNGVTDAAQLKTIIAAGGLSAADSYAFYKGGEVTSSGLANNNATGSGLSITYNPTGGAAGNTYEAVLFAESSDGKSASYTDLKSITLENDASDQNWAFGNQRTTMGNNTFAVAPEPTSGLLLLVGVAGLALRRRRA